MTAAIASTTSDHTAHPGRSWPRNGRGDYCGSGIERSRLLGDLVVASSPGWVRYAVAEACAGRVPRTMAYVVPSVTGGLDIDLGGRMVVRRGMAFTGEADDGASVEERSVVDRFEEMGWPAWRVAKVTA